MTANKFSSSGSLFSGEPLSLICLDLDVFPCISYIVLLWDSYISVMSSEATSGICHGGLQGLLGARLHRPGWQGRAHPGQDKVLPGAQPVPAPPWRQPARGQALQQGAALVCVEVEGRDKPTKLIFPFSGRASTGQNMHMIHYSINFSCAFCSLSSSRKAVWHLLSYVAIGAVDT